MINHKELMDKYYKIYIEKYCSNQNVTFNLNSNNISQTLKDVEYFRSQFIYFSKTNQNKRLIYNQIYDNLKCENKLTKNTSTVESLGNIDFDLSQSFLTKESALYMSNLLTNPTVFGKNIYNTRQENNDEKIESNLNDSIDLKNCNDFIDEEKMIPVSQMQSPNIKLDQNEKTSLIKNDILNLNSEDKLQHIIDSHITTVNKDKDNNKEDNKNESRIIKSKVSNKENSNSNKNEQIKNNEKDKIKLSSITEQHETNSSNILAEENSNSNNSNKADSELNKSIENEINVNNKGLNIKEFVESSSKPPLDKNKINLNQVKNSKPNNNNSYQLNQYNNNNQNHHLNTNNSNYSENNRLNTFSDLSERNHESRNYFGEENIKMYNQLDSLLIGFITSKRIDLKYIKFNMHMSSANIKDFINLEDVYFLEHFYPSLNVNEFNEQNLKSLVSKFPNRYEGYFLLICFYYNKMKFDLKKDTKELLIETINTSKTKILNNQIINTSLDDYILKPLLLYKMYEHKVEDKSVLSFYDLNKLFYIKYLLRLNTPNDLVKCYYELKTFINDFSNKEEFSYIFSYYIGKLFKRLIENKLSIKDSDILLILDYKDRSFYEQKLELILKSYKPKNLDKKGKHYIRISKIGEYYKGNQNEMLGLYKEGCNILNKLKSGL